MLYGVKVLLVVMTCAPNLIDCHPAQTAHPEWRDMDSCREEAARLAALPHRDGDVVFAKCRYDLIEADDAPPLS